MRTSWISGAFAAVVLIGGCAHNEMKEEAELGRIPMEQKQQINVAQHNVSVAEANVASSQQALDRAKSFRAIASDEVKAARSRLSAADKMTSLGRAQTGDVGIPGQGQGQGRIQVGQREADLAQRQLASSSAMLDYANRVVDLRSDELALARRQLAQTQADLRIARIDTLQRANVPSPENITTVTALRDRIAGDVMQRQRDVAAKQAQVDSMKSAWDTARRSYNVAARETPVTPMMTPPSDAPKLQLQPLPGASTPAQPGGGSTM